MRHSGRVTHRVRSRAMNAVLAACLGLMALLVVVAPVGSGAVRLAWVVVTSLGCALLVRRALRMAVIANDDGIVVRNLGRDYVIGWDRIAEIRAGRSDNVTGAAKTIYISCADGSQIAARAASSYSSAKVNRWRDELNALAPGHA